MDIEALENMLNRSQDNLLLRFGLGQALFKAENYAEAIAHLEKALEFDPSHSASRKILGKAYAAAGNNERASKIYRQGIEIAENNGDIQAAKEMKVFLRRLENQPPRQAPDD